MKRILVAILLATFAVPALAGGTQYVMRVDGLACPYCAYGIEKKLSGIEGVRADTIDIDLEKGIVVVEVDEGVTLTEKRMRKLYEEAGFTFRRMESRPLDDNDNGQ